MKIKLLIAASDSDYVEHLSSVLSENYSDIFEVVVSSQADRLKDLIQDNRFDVLLLEPAFFSFIDLSLVKLPIILWDRLSEDIEDYEVLNKIEKYQRISSIAGTILEKYSEISSSVNKFSYEKTNITAIWSPSGGVGKTTVALAYAARKALGDNNVVYLNLENFSSTQIYFPERGKSISTAFEKLESNLPMFLKGIRQYDSGSGISYFNGPTNYDDINILTKEDVETLINACAVGVDELVIDLSSQCDERIQKIFELADTIMLVCDQSKTSQTKLRQFLNQHSISQKIEFKSILVNNKGAKVIEPSFTRIIDLQIVQSTDPISIYKTLSGSKFE